MIVCELSEKINSVHLFHNVTAAELHRQFTVQVDFARNIARDYCISTGEHQHAVETFEICTHQHLVSGRCILVKLLRPSPWADSGPASSADSLLAGHDRSQSSGSLVSHSHEIDQAKQLLKFQMSSWLNGFPMQVEWCHRHP